MALKDWKKYGKNQWLNESVSKLKYPLNERKAYMVEIQTTNYPSDWKIDHYVVVVWTEDERVLIQKFFKTDYAKALKFAKNYMKTSKLLKGETK